MIVLLWILLVIVVVGGITVAARSVRVVQQYERGLVFRFGRVLAGPRGPGLTLIRPIGDRLQKVNMQIVAMAVPAQEGITRDNVSVRVDAVVYFRVVDPIKAVVNVQNYMFAVSQQAQTSLRSIIGQSEMDQLLAERDTVNRELRRIIDEPTEGPWGIRVERVEIKDVNLPEGMKRSMSRQAEAERERRARIITADGEYQASKRLAAAANVMARDPAALQLRLLQTVVEVASERNSTLVMPVPVELLRFFEKMAPTSARNVPPPPVDKGDAEVAQAEAQIDKAGIGELGATPTPELPTPEIPPVPAAAATASEADVAAVEAVAAAAAAEAGQVPEAQVPEVAGGARRTGESARTGETPPAGEPARTGEAPPARQAPVTGKAARAGETPRTDGESATVDETGEAGEADEEHAGPAATASAAAVPRRRKARS